jgi:hypothetical protein
MCIVSELAMYFFPSRGKSKVSMHVCSTGIHGGLTFCQMRPQVIHNLRCKPTYHTECRAFVSTWFPTLAYSQMWGTPSAHLARAGNDGRSPSAYLRQSSYPFQRSNIKVLSVVTRGVPSRRSGHVVVTDCRQPLYWTTA